MVEEVGYPAPTPEGRANVFLQWKGTDACFTFTCTCGHDGHFDGYFAGHIECGGCGRFWIMPATIYPLAVDEARQPHTVWTSVKPTEDGTPEDGW